MSMLIISNNPKDAWTDSWIKALQQVDPQINVQVWPDVKDPASIDFAFVWNYPPGILAKFPNLKCISSMGAGVDHILDDPYWPRTVPLVRLVDQNLVRDMTQYVIWAVLNHSRQFDFYQQSQQRELWIRRSYADLPGVGIMGLGQLGSDVAIKLRDLGFKVRGWADSSKVIPGIESFIGQEQFTDFLKQSGILICLLPLTPLTRGILNKKSFAHLPQGAYIINVARGAHLVEKDLLAAIDSDHLSGACLDVFANEPLPPKHPFWQHPKIRITPHISSMTDPFSAAQQVVENYHRLLANQPLLNQVNVEKGY